MDPSKLMELGLSKREANAYLALLSREEGKAGDIARDCQEDRTNVYDSLLGLVKKGLANHFMRNGRTYYRVAPPDRLLEFVQEKERAALELMPQLNKTYKSYRPKPNVETYEGALGVKTVLRDILKEGKDFVGFGATDRAAELLPEFTRTYLRERQKRGIRARQLHARGGGVLPSKLSVFKSIPREFSGPATTLIYGDKVALMLWFTHPPVVVLIKSREAAQAYRQQFEFMWKKAKPENRLTV